jgi:hypothetical protein
MLSRLKPYTSTQVSWNTIFQKTLRIPMNQREYSWDSNERIKFIDDIFKIYEEGKYVEKMGSIINSNYNNTNDIYDGQQRILTVALILKVISCYSPKLKNKVDGSLTVDTDIDTLTREQIEIKEKYNMTVIPKIYCVNPFDMKALVNIFNDNADSWTNYVSNIHEFESFDDDEDYVCNKCDCTISRKYNFIRHIKTQHDYSSNESNTSKLYPAFEEICSYFAIKKYDEPKIIDLYKFIMNDIDIQYYDCYDPKYVSWVFDWENNRGCNVQTLDIIKNPILVEIPDDKKLEIYEKWEFLKHTENKIYKKNYGQKIFDIAIQIYNNKITRTINLEELFKPIIQSHDTYVEIYKFFEIVEKLLKIMDAICNDKFGRLINNTSRISLTWEAYMWCLLPIFYKTNNIDGKLIKLMVTWYFRNIQFKTRSFNNLCYSNEFIRITNEVLMDEHYDYYTHLNECIVKNKDDSINDENYLQTMKVMKFKSTNPTYLLLFLETCINTDLHRVSLDYTLEHVYCQKHKSNLKNPSLMDYIGNLTLIEGKNSDNGHKGNSALGAKTYDKKIISYKGSSSSVTRDIPEKYTDFEEEHIIERNAEIVSLLNRYTNY